MDQAEDDQFDLDLLLTTSTSTVSRRDSAVSSSSSKRFSISSDSWPTTPLVPHTPTGFIFPRSSSGQSIPIFFDADDVAAITDEGGSEEIDDGSATKLTKRPGSLQRPLEPLADFEMNRLSSAYSSSSASSRCLSIDTASVASVSTAPTEPPSPSPTLSNGSGECSPPPFPLPLPLPISACARAHGSVSATHPLLNARRNVVLRPGSACSPPGRQRSFSSNPTPSTPHFAARPQHSHHCIRPRQPPRSADSTAKSFSPPSDAFFDPAGSRPSTTSSTFSGASRPIPIRLVPPTPTPADRERASALHTRPRALHHSPSSPVLKIASSSRSPPLPPASANARDVRTKPLPSLPVFPTRPSPSPNLTRSSPPSTSSGIPSHARHRSRSEGVYNVPIFPPCIYPPSPPRPFVAPTPAPPPSATSSRHSPRVRLASKFSYRHLLSRDGGARVDDDDPFGEIESAPLIQQSRRAPGARRTIASRGSDSVSSSTTTTTTIEPEGVQVRVGETTLQLLIDQEGFRDAKVEFVYTGDDDETGLLEFVAKRPEVGLEREGWPFHVGFLQTPPHLRRLHLNDNETIDYLRREASLSVGNKDGVYKVSSHTNVDLELAHGGAKDIEGPYFSFAYETKRRLNLVGRPMKGERLLRPLVFVCSREFLDPRQGRKVGFRHLIARTFTIPTSASLVVRKQKSVSALKLSGERDRSRSSNKKGCVA